MWYIEQLICLILCHYQNPGNLCTLQPSSDVHQFFSLTLSAITFPPLLSPPLLVLVLLVTATTATTLSFHRHRPQTLVKVFSDRIGIKAGPLLWVHCSSLLGYNCIWGWKVVWLSCASFQNSLPLLFTMTCRHTERYSKGELLDPSVYQVNGITSFSCESCGRRERLTVA